MIVKQQLEQCSAPRAFLATSVVDALSRSIFTMVQQVALATTVMSGELSNAHVLSVKALKAPFICQ